MKSKHPKITTIVRSSKIWDSKVWYIVLLTSSLRNECSFPLATSDFNYRTVTVSECRRVSRWVFLNFLKLCLWLVSVSGRVGESAVGEKKNTVGESLCRPVVCRWVVIDSFHLHFLDILLYGLSNRVQILCWKFSGVRIFRIFTVLFFWKTLERGNFQGVGQMKIP